MNPRLCCVSLLSFASSSVSVKRSPFRYQPYKNRPARSTTGTATDRTSCSTYADATSRFQQCLGFATAAHTGSSDADEREERYNLKSIATDLAASRYKNAIVVVGAGLSCAAGIPDFRSPGTGLYENLQKYRLPFPEAIFELDFYRTNPMPFVDLAKEIWPGQSSGPKPTIGHSFLRLLEERGCLRRVYTQNIDGLESLAGVSDDKLVECHGHFRSCSCISCGTRCSDINECRESFLSGHVHRCSVCGGLSKPDIVFFGEPLNERFTTLIDRDMHKCDLLIVMGTSLLVNPVATIPSWCGKNVPRLLINRELVGDFAKENSAVADKSSATTKSRDVWEEIDCDDGVIKLCKLAGWENDLTKLHYGN